MRNHLFRYKTLLFCTITIIVISSAVGVLIAFVLKNILDLLSINANSQQFSRTIIMSGLFLVFTSLMTFIKRYMKALYVKKVIIDLKSNVFKNISNLSVTRFNSQNSGGYVSNLTNDIKLIETNYLSNVLNIFDDICSFSIAVLALIHLNIYLAIVTAILSVLPLLVPKFTHKKMAVLTQTYSNTLGKFTAQVKDIFTGFEVIKSFNLYNKVYDTYNQESYHVEEAKYRSTVYQSGVNSVSTFLSYGVQFTTIAVGVYLARMNLITIGTIVAAGQLMNYILDPVVQISARINAIKSSKPIIEKIEALVEPENELASSKVKGEYKEKIVFSNVSFSYDDKVQALRNVSFTIEKGKKYAIVGQSGSGKSTLVRLLLNYYPNYSGVIEIDGLQLSEIDPESVYEMISMIHQNVFLFDTTIKENITLYQDYTEEQVKEAIQRSGLAQLINSLADQENTYIGEAGNKLSGGEKQRIAMARALVRNTPILLLDEAMASLDHAMAYSLETSILNLTEVTALVITHKLSPELLAQYDTILVMRNGEIVERGSFQQLLENKEYFYSLYFTNVSQG